MEPTRLQGAALLVAVTIILRSTTTVGVHWSLSIRLEFEGWDFTSVEGVERMPVGPKGEKRKGDVSRCCYSGCQDCYWRRLEDTKDELSSAAAEMGRKGGKANARKPLPREQRSNCKESALNGGRTNERCLWKSRSGMEY